MRNRRALDLEGEQAVDRRSDRDVGHGQPLAGDESLVRELGIEGLQGVAQILCQGRNHCGVAQRRLGADDGPEEVDVGRVERGLVPLHPLVGAGATRFVVGQQGAGAVAATEVAHHGIGLEDHQIAVDKSRDAAVRVERSVVGPIEAAEGAADVVPDVRQSELTERPHDGHDVAGVPPPPDLDHTAGSHSPRFETS